MTDIGENRIGLSDSPLELARLQVLVVEDNLHMRKLIKTILYALGIKGLREATDGAEALKELKTFPADLVLTDWLMEPVDGIELVRQIRNGKNSTNEYLPVVMISGHSSRDSIISARDAGVNEFLVKPISAKGLYQRIVSIIERPRPFVRTKNFFGPCRRRHNWSQYTGPERRNPDENADGPMSQDDVNELLNALDG